MRATQARRTLKSHPSIQLFTHLLNRALDKPAEQEQPVAEQRTSCTVTRRAGGCCDTAMHVATRRGAALRGADPATDPLSGARAHFLTRAGEEIPQRLIAEMRQIPHDTVARLDAEGLNDGARRSSCRKTHEP